jgi:hypothetical protein
MKAALVVEVHQHDVWPDERDTAAVAYWRTACLEDNGVSSVRESVVDPFADDTRPGPHPKTCREPKV